MAFSHGTPNSIVTDGLEFCIDSANKNSYPGSGATVTDLIGTNNGTLANATFSSNNGGVWDFDGTDTGVIDFTRFGGTTNSISCWFKASSVSEDTSQSIWANGNNNYNGIHLQIGTSGELRIFDDIQNRNTYWYATSISAGIWYNAVVTVNGSKQNQLYINGEAVGNGTGTSYQPWSYLNVGTFMIGKYLSGTGTLYPFSGEVSNVMHYNTTLSASEVFQNYNALKNRFRT
tara:strand:+ start:590 stop:1282 length:693 start_codon:yes stop_codon:yes gene_type:complete